MPRTPWPQFKSQKLQKFKQCGVFRPVFSVKMWGKRLGSRSGGGSGRQSLGGKEGKDNPPRFQQAVGFLKLHPWLSMTILVHSIYPAWQKFSSPNCEKKFSSNHEQVTSLSLNHIYAKFPDWKLSGPLCVTPLANKSLRTFYCVCYTAVTGCSNNVTELTLNLPPCKASWEV